MKNSIAVVALLLLTACSDKPKESYSQKIDRYELEVGIMSVAYFEEQAEKLAEQPLEPVLMDTPSNYKTPSIFAQNSSAADITKPQ